MVLNEKLSQDIENDLYKMMDGLVENKDYMSLANILIGVKMTISEKKLKYYTSIITTNLYTPSAKPQRTNEEISDRVYAFTK